MRVSISDAAIKFSALRVGQGERLWACIRFFGNAIPDILDELDSLGNRKVAIVEGRLAHGGNMRRGPSGNQLAISAKV